MQRQLLEALIQWKNAAEHMPLLLRGSRQVGKTYLIEHFGRTHFQHIVTLNFEHDAHLKKCFDTLNPRVILDALTLQTGASITPGETLLFLDEIQYCPKALEALRYFKERMPDLHVIGAGSLLEFMIEEEELSIPVGRVQYLYLYPLSFYEFLSAGPHEHWVAYLNDVNIGTDISIHEALLTQLRYYTALGGMPKVVDTYYKTQDPVQAQNMQRVILNTYHDDFPKYAKRHQIRHLQTVFEKLPGLVAKQFKYVDCDPDTNARELKKAIRALHCAGLTYPVYAVSASGIPLASQKNEKKFKLMMLDVGLMRHDANMTMQVMMDRDLLMVNRGSVAEQLVAQMLIAHGNPYWQAELFYWVREKQGSMAEVDYVINVDEHIIPLEVKAGATGRLRSIQQFMQEKKSPLGVQISQAPLSFNGQILSVPLYMVAEIPRLVREILQND